MRRWAVSYRRASKRFCIGRRSFGLLKRRKGFFFICFLAQTETMKLEFTYWLGMIS